MGSGQSEQDRKIERELREALDKTDWNIAGYTETDEGVIVTFRKRHLSDEFANVEKREVHGTDRADALRQFLAELPG